MAAATRDAAAVSADYMRWAADAGIATKLAQAFFGELRGAKAVEDTAPEEPLVTVPRAAALVLAPQARCPLPDLDGKAWKELPW